MYHGGCEVMQINPLLGQQHASPDTEWKIPSVQWPESNISVRKLLLLIYKDDIY